MTAGTIKDEREFQTYRTLHRALLVCGILSSLFYVFINVLTVFLYKGYDAFSQTVSELSAIGAPTISLWVSLIIFYSLLVIAFSYGVWLSGSRSKHLRATAILLFTYIVIGFFWPPMHQREVLAAGGKTLTDTLHIVFTLITVPLMMLVIGFGAAAFGNSFRIYSIFTLVVLVVFGALTGLNSPRLEANLPTPWIGVWERINIGAYMLWIAVFSILLLRKEKVNFNQQHLLKDKQGLI